jgi:predicted esterase
MDEVELPDISVKNEYYLLGYSQGGWATLQLTKLLSWITTGILTLKEAVAELAHIIYII